MQDGEIMKKIGVDNGTFSLGITVDDQARIIAVVRGQPLLRIFQVKILMVFYFGDFKIISIKFEIFRTITAHIIRYFIYP